MTAILDISAAGYLTIERTVVWHKTGRNQTQRKDLINIAKQSEVVGGSNQPYSTFIHSKQRYKNINVQSLTTFSVFLLSLWAKLEDFLIR